MVLAWAVHLAQQDRVAALLCNTLNVRATKALHAAGFVRRRNQGIRFIVYTPDDQDKRDVILDPDRWFLTSADSDLD